MQGEHERRPRASSGPVIVKDALLRKTSPSFSYRPLPVGGNIMMISPMHRIFAVHSESDFNQPAELGMK